MRDLLEDGTRLVQLTGGGAWHIVDTARAALPRVRTECGRERDSNDPGVSFRVRVVIGRHEAQRLCTRCLACAPRVVQPLVAP